MCLSSVPLYRQSSDMPVEPLPEDKARRALERLKLLSKIREVILPHPLLDERLKLCQPSADIPDWWVPGKHDKDLLIGVAKSFGIPTLMHVRVPSITVSV
ncbi:hypothetical protein BC332_34612 [Capsicum chinense]|nr:hypothetical protein BC332_34612 [Capsicum chinense]